MGQCCEPQTTNFESKTVQVIQSYTPPTLDEPSGTVAVIGATGKQGGAVVRALLAQQKFSIRALTRNPNSKKARALAVQGVEVVQGDLGSIDSLADAFDGCYGVFAVTNFWADMKAETELTQAKNIAAACKINNVKHIVWSTLEDTSPVMKGRKKVGKYHVAHFDVKEEIDAIFNKSGVPTTCVVTSFFYENWIDTMPPTDYGNGYVIGMNLGQSKLCMMALDDFGRVAALVFSKPEYKGQRFGFASDALTGNEIAAAFTKHKNTEIQYYAMQDEDVEQAVGWEMSEMFVYYRKGAQTIRKLRSGSDKYTKLTKFDAWLAANKDLIKLKSTVENDEAKDADEPSGTIAVIGATGKQGSNVIKALLAKKNFKIRALTRNPESKKAAELVAQGVEVVKGDLADTDSLVAAFRGCYGVFAVTNFWADMKVATEIQQARNIAEAAKTTNIQHLLWSTLEDTSPVMKGQPKSEGYYVAHFDGKEVIDGIFRESGVPTTCVITSFFYENFADVLAPKDYGNGYVLGMNMGQSKLSMMDLGDFGRVCASVFSKPEYKGQRFGFRSDELSLNEIAAILAKHKKATISYYEMEDKAVLSAAGFEMAQMFVYYREGVKQISELRSGSEKHTKQTKFEDWVAANHERIPLL